MKFWRALTVLRTVGIILTVVGELSKRLGEVLTGPNLGPIENIPSADDRNEPQDPLAPIGAEDEKPEEQEPNEHFGSERYPY